MQKLDKNSHVPLYHQLKQKLVKLLNTSYKPGDAIPTEKELEKQYGVSRMTVRLAVNALVDEGLVVKEQGKGTFVQEQKITHELKGVTSWTKQIKKRGLVPKTIALEIEKVLPSSRMQQMLGVNENDTVIKLKRVRYASDEPMCIMVNYLSGSKVPGIIEKGFKEESLYDYLKKEYDLTINKAYETVEARLVSEIDAQMLNIEPGSPVLQVTRISYINDNSPIEVAVVTSRADRYQYKILLTEES